MTEHPGLFLSFEGTEGSGKSTQMRLLVDRLRNEGHRVVENQEPGGTRIGKEIRRVLLDPAHTEIAPMTELLLMFASRTQAAAEVIQPGLKDGSIVVSDRYTDSTLAYQGMARGLGFDLVLNAHKLALGSLMPSLTLCIELDIEEGLGRAHRRNQRKTGQVDEDRIDLQSLDFHRRVQEGYRRIAEMDPARFRLIDGSGSVSRVAQRVWDTVVPLLIAQETRR